MPAGILPGGTVREERPGSTVVLLFYYRCYTISFRFEQRNSRFAIHVSSLAFLGIYLIDRLVCPIMRLPIGMP